MVDASSIVSLLGVEAALARLIDQDITYMRNVTVRAACLFEVEATAQAWASSMGSQAFVENVRPRNLACQCPCCWLQF